ncbi:MAG: right-handed parallel beta-helix repeat-containing protein [bacterium]|nr:right-handed parallel beta-helix repeat-containing protein [bacterium]
MSARTLLSCLLLVAPLASAAGAAPVAWHVSPAGNDAAAGSAADPFATIQFAVDIAADGDTVRLAGGTYSGAGNAPVAWADKGLVIVSADGDPESCIVACAGQDGFRFIDTDLSDAHGLHIAGISFADADTAVAVLRAVNGPNPRVWLGLTRCAARNGNVGVASNGGWLVLDDCTLSGNATAGIAGGFTFGLTMSDCIVRGNGVGLIFTQMNPSSHVEVTGCAFVGNGSGIRYWQEGGGMTLRQCRVDSSSTSHGIRTSSDFEGLLLDGCTINGNAGHGIANSQGSAVIMTGGEACGNGLSGVAMDVADAALRLDGVRLAGNGGWGVGRYLRSDGKSGVDESGAVGPGVRDQGSVSGSPDKDPAHDIDIRGCDIVGNLAGGVALTGVFDPLVIEESTIAGNGGAGLQVGSTRVGALCGIARVTVVDNQGDGLEVTAGAWDLAQVLVSHNQGQAVVVSGAGATVLPSCTDLFGNLGGDWTGALLPYLNTAGNVSVDPSYCDLAAGDYTLRDDSPLSPAYSDGCGLIGRHEVACPAPPSLVAPVPRGAESLALASWPNPFNPRATVAFDLQRAAHARLALYDLAGRLVRVLVDEQVNAGRHEAVWDGRDNAGRNAASGVYVARLVSAGAGGSVRMHLIR